MSAEPIQLAPLPDKPIITLASLPRSSAMLTRKEAATVLGIPVSTVNLLIDSGRLKAKWHTKKRCTVAWEWLIEYAAKPNTRMRQQWRRPKCS